MYRSHWSHNSQSDFVNCTSSHTVSCFFINYVAVDCGTPSSLSNGQRRYSSITFGSTVNYTCNTGYRMTAGSSSRTCQSNGVWSGSHPTCTRKSTLYHFISFTYWLQTCKRIAIIYWLFIPFQFIFLKPNVSLSNWEHIILFMLFISCCSHIAKWSHHRQSDFVYIKSYYSMFPCCKKLSAPCGTCQIEINCVWCCMEWCTFVCVHVVHSSWPLLSFSTISFICTWILTKCVCMYRFHWSHHRQSLFVYIKSYYSMLLNKVSVHRRRNHGGTGGTDPHKFSYGPWIKSLGHTAFIRNCTYLQPSLVCKWAPMMFTLFLFHHKRKFEEEFHQVAAYELAAIVLWCHDTCLLQNIRLACTNTRLQCPPKQNLPPSMRGPVVLVK